jgi:hypothetical protein
MPTKADAAQGTLVLVPKVWDRSPVPVPKPLAGARGLHVWPRIELPPGAVCVYVLTALRPPEAPGMCVRCEAVYVGRTVDLNRRQGEHRGRAGRVPRSGGKRQPPLPFFRDVVFFIEDSRRAGALERALIKTLLPIGNVQHKALTSRWGGLSVPERRALERWGIAEGTAY